MAAEVVGRAVLPAREGWWPTWMQRLLGRGRKSRRRRVVEREVEREVAEVSEFVIVDSSPLASPRGW
jgi:hypothetical protein